MTGLVNGGQEATQLTVRQTRVEVVDVVRYRSNARMGDRVVDCARLESVCAERHRGFESPPIRQFCLALNRAPALIRVRSRP